MSAPLHLYPAIDLKQGQCVRLTRGEMASAKTYNPDPAAQARAFEAAGFRCLHVVDLDGAFSGKSENTKAVQSIIHNVSIPLQLGGGIRTRADIDHWLTQGVTRVILGTAAARNPDLVRTAARDLPGRIAIGIDAKDGRVAVEGWAEASDLTAEELAKRYAGAGTAALIFTDVARDGVGAGLNVDATRRLAAAVPGTDVIASGGFASLADIDACRAAGLIHGAIIGRALYEGAIDPAAALERAGW